MYWEAFRTTSCAVGVWTLLISSFLLTLTADAWVLPSLTTSNRNSNKLSEIIRHNGHQNRQAIRLQVGSLGWDNDNYLNALSKGADAISKANAEYDALKRFGYRPTPGGGSGGDGNDEEDIDGPNKVMMSSSSSNSDDSDLDLADASTIGAELTSEMKLKMKASHSPEEAASQGGRMFLELMARAQQQQQQQQFKQQPPSYVPPLAAAAAPVVIPPVSAQFPAIVPPSPPQMNPTAPMVGAAAAAVPLSGVNMDQLSVEDQAALFRQMMTQQQMVAAASQQQQQQPTPPPPIMMTMPPMQQPQTASPPPAVAPDGRRIGRNRDADAIVNTSDVYFAQLKRDSTVRNLYRRSGNDQKANAVFDDPGIAQIQLHINPYLEEAKEKERAMFETSVEEMVDPTKLFAPEPPVDTSYTGVRYKDKLRLKKQQQQQQQDRPAAAPRQQQAPVSVPPSPPVAPHPITAMSSPASSSFRNTANPTIQQQQEQRPQVFSSSPLPSPPRPVDSIPQAVMSPPVASETTLKATTNTDVNDDVLRNDLRTLMGLLIKHRGGPGFGSGRLTRDADIQRLEQLARSVELALRQERPIPQNVAATVNTHFDAAASSFETSTTTTKTSPPPSSGSVATPWKDVVTSTYDTPSVTSASKQPATAAGVAAAATTVTSAGGAIEPGFRTPMSGGDRIESTLACIDGAIHMYRHAPPELQGHVLMTMRAALLSAVQTCNQILAETELEQAKTFRRMQENQDMSNRNVHFDTVDERDDDDVDGSAFTTAATMTTTSTSTTTTTAASSSSSSSSSSSGPISTSSTKPLQFYDVIPEVLDENDLPDLIQESARDAETFQQDFQDDELASKSVTTESLPSTPLRSSSSSSSSTTGMDANAAFLSNLYDQLAAVKGLGKMGIDPSISPNQAATLVQDLVSMKQILVEELEQTTIPQHISQPIISSSSSSSSTNEEEQLKMSAVARYQEMMAQAKAKKDASYQEE